MRIGYIIPDVGISGGLNVVLTHANFLLACGHDVFLVAMAPDTTISWRKNLCPIFSWTDENIWILVHSQPNDFIIATAWQTAFPLLGRHFLANHYVYFVQSDERRFYTPGTVEAQLAGVTYGMKCSYLTEAKWIKGWLSEYGIDAYYARNGVDRQIFRPCDPIIPRSKKLRVLLEGPISIPFKRVRDAYVAVSGLDVEIWLVSSDGGPDVSMKVDRFFEKVPLAVMPKIYSSCDVLIKLSEVEGMFGPPLEMMACGGTAITSDVNGHDEFMKHGVNGFVCKKGDIRSVRSYVNRLIDDKDLLAKLQKGGIETANQFDWHSTLQRVEEWLTSLNKLTNVDAESVLTPVDSFRDAVAICTKSFEKLYSYPPSFQCQVGLGFSLDPKGVYLVEASGWLACTRFG